MLKMMRGKIIVDTSVWIEYFKNNQRYVGYIEENLYLDSVYITGPVIAELIQGVKGDKEYLLLADSINAIPYLECNLKDWIMAGEISFNLRKNGRTIPVTDALIAAVSIKSNAKILTLDNHFKDIPGVNLV
jgi:tRNA(fMet)-specific endonuclease VapC